MVLHMELQHAHQWMCASVCVRWNARQDGELRASKAAVPPAFSQWSLHPIEVDLTHC